VGSVAAKKPAAPVTLIAVGQEKKGNVLEIIIDTKVDWDGAFKENIQRLLENVTGHFNKHLVSKPQGRIFISFQPSYPQTLFRNSCKDPYPVLLAVKGLLWSQYAFQFAHEYCHIACHYEKLHKTENHWFQETLCEVVSLFTLREMAISWQRNPPYSNWSDYSQHLYNYAEERIIDNKHQLPAGITCSQFFLENKVELRHNSIMRENNTTIALQILPIFERNPKHWQSIRYLPNSSGTFQFFLSRWHKNVPIEHKSFVQRIATIFFPDWLPKL
jgi:hypothetical protein